MQRLSKQRQLILDNLAERCDHPTAEMVYSSVREIMPNISLGTVYRNLGNLSEEGEILSFSVNGKEHFDGNKIPHIHLHCNKCGSIKDEALPADFFSCFSNEMSDIGNVIIYGICTECKNK